MAKKKSTKKKVVQAKAAPRKVARKKPVSKKVAAKKKTTSGTTPARKTAATPEERIADVDRELVRLLNERTSLFVEKTEKSETPSRAMFDLGDDAALWQRVEKENKGPLNPNEIKSVFRTVLSASRQRIRRTRVSYLGPAYTFTHLAAIHQFGESADLVPVSTIATVFDEVNRGHVDFGVVPIENSTDGRVVDTLDMFTRLPLRICGEVQLHVHQNLLARCERSEINEIYSKPQALSQCREWLARNMPHARLIEVTSTSTAAQLAREKPGAAAVASQQAAVQYEVQIIAENIEDNRNNITRFAVIGDAMGEATGHDRTAVLLQISHKPGALSDALTIFKRCRINLTWIESFPLRAPESGYLFFLDFEGHVSDPKIRKALKELEAMANRLEVLGSYPRSEPAN